MASDPVATYLQLNLRNLQRRKAYTHKWAPTNKQLRAIIDTLAQDIQLIRTLSDHRVDLIEIAKACFWGIRQRDQLNETKKQLRPLQNTRKKRTWRAKKQSVRGKNLVPTPADLTRFVFRYSQQQRREHLSKKIDRLTTYYPGIALPKHKASTGRRQDLPAKIVHLELEDYFSRIHPNVVVSQRDQWIRTILRATELDYPSEETFRKQKTRLRKIFPSLLLAPR